MQFRSDQGSSKIYVYDGQGTSTPLHVLEKLHTKPVCIIRYNVQFDVVVSVDQAGILEYWTGPKQDYKFPSKLVSFESKLDTSRNPFSFIKRKRVLHRNLHFQVCTNLPKAKPSCPVSPFQWMGRNLLLCQPIVRYW